MVGLEDYTCVCSEDKNPSCLSWHLILVPSLYLLLIFLYLHYFTLQISHKKRAKTWSKMSTIWKGNLIFLRRQEKSVLSGMGSFATCFDVSIFKISVLFCMILPNNELCWLTVLQMRISLLQRLESIWHFQITPKYSEKQCCIFQHSKKYHTWVWC